MDTVNTLRSLCYLVMSYEELQEEAKKIAQETRERTEREERKI